MTSTVSLINASDKVPWSQDLIKLNNSQESAGRQKTSSDPTCCTATVDGKHMEALEERKPPDSQNAVEFTVHQRPP